MHARALAAIAFALLASGCAPDEDAFVDGELGVAREGLSVGGAGGCSTAIVAGLSKQLIAEQNCIRPNALDSFAGVSGVSIGAGVNAYLEPNAVSGLKAAVAAHGGTISINSALRTLAQQYLLYKWQGTCGIQIAATPGNSNHETGIAIDVGDYSGWRTSLEAHGWRWYGSGDVVHYDYIGAGSVDLRADSVEAFQRLWNLNNPGDQIAEDGAWGPATEARLAKTDANGFAKGSTCSVTPPPPPPPPPPADPKWDAAQVQTSGPAQLGAGQSATFWVEFKNTGTSAWAPGKTFLGTTDARDRTSALANDGWVAPNRAATVDKETAAGEIGRFTFVVIAPPSVDGNAYEEHFGLVEEGVAWFGGDQAYVLALEVTPANGVHPPYSVVVPPAGADPVVLGESANTITTHGYDPATGMQEPKITLCQIRAA